MEICKETQDQEHPATLLANPHAPFFTSSLPTDESQRPGPASYFQSDSRLKRCHTRNQPEGHVPRPRNAFILFRCDFVRQKKIPEDVENDHRNISRIVGRIWREMNDKDKAPWLEMAETEKTLHRQRYRGYKYVSTSTRVKKKLKRGDDQVDSAEGLWNVQGSMPARRSSSCPPGPERVYPSFAGSSIPSNDIPPLARDDLVRRPSRVVMYHSGASTRAALMDPAPDIRESTTFTSGPYSLGAPIDAPGWDSLPMPPEEWKHWDDRRRFTTSETALHLPMMDMYWQNPNALGATRGEESGPDVSPSPLFRDPFDPAFPLLHQAPDPSYQKLHDKLIRDEGEGGIMPAFSFGQSQGLDRDFSPPSNEELMFHRQNNRSATGYPCDTSSSCDKELNLMQSTDTELASLIPRFSMSDWLSPDENNFLSNGGESSFTETSRNQ